MGWRMKVGATVSTFVVLVGGYLTADALDLVPGMLTIEPPHPEPAPFPLVPGALVGPGLEEVHLGLPEAAPAPTTSEIQALVDAMTEDTRLGPRLGIVITDVMTGETLGSAMPNDLFAPASTQKVFTAVAVHNELDVESRIPTTAWLYRGDHVFLVGAGDMLLAPDAGNPDAVNGRAGLGDLADQVAGYLTEAGVGTVRVSVVDDLFTGPLWPAAVPDGDIAAGHMARVMTLGVDVGARDPNSTGSGRPRWDDPAVNAGEQFATALFNRGITIGGSVRRSELPGEAEQIGLVESATIAEISRWTQLRSDNTMTEVLGRLVAIAMGRPATGVDALGAVLDSVAGLGLDTRNAVLRDLSGLGRGSLVSPQTLVDLIAVALNPANPHLRQAVVDLPVCGLTGTLTSRCAPTALLPDNPAVGFARAKTGSLPGVRGLTGTILTADDRLLAFAINADAIEPEAVVGATMIYDRFLGQLAALDDPNWAPDFAQEGTE